MGNSSDFSINGGAGNTQRALLVNDTTSPSASDSTSNDRDKCDCDGKTSALASLAAFFALLAGNIEYFTNKDVNDPPDPFCVSLRNFGTVLAPVLCFPIQPEWKLPIISSTTLAALSFIPIVAWKSEPKKAGYIAAAIHSIALALMWNVFEKDPKKRTELTIIRRTIGAFATEALYKGFQGYPSENVGTVIGNLGFVASSIVALPPASYKYLARQLFVPLTVSITGQMLIRDPDAKFCTTFLANFVALTALWYQASRKIQEEIMDQQAAAPATSV